MILLSLLIRVCFGRTQRRHSILSLVSIISTISIALGVAVLIISLSLINGFENELKDRILAVFPHGEIEAVNQSWYNWRDTLIKVKNVPGVIEAAPYINFTGLIENGINLRVIQIRGVDLQKEVYLSALPKFVQNNAWRDFRADEKQIIIGKGVADALKVKRGDWISIMISDTSTNHNLKQPKYLRLHLIGILQLNGQLDHNFAIVPLTDARQYLDMDNAITGIAIKVNDVFKANKLMNNVAEVTRNYVYIRSWIDNYGHMYRDIQMVRSIIHLTMILVIGVACFNIVSTLVIAAKEKSGDIAVLWTLGANDALIRTIFICYGFLTGFFGSLFGVVIGVLISSKIALIINGVERLMGHRFLSSKVYFIDFLPSELHWLNVIYVLVVTFLLSLLASWYPAYYASRIDPAKVLSSQ